MGWQPLWPLDYGKFTVWLPRDLRGVQPQEFALPPVSGSAFFLHRGKPVLPQDRSHVAWRRLTKWIGLKQRKHVRVVLQQAFFGERHKVVLLPVAEIGRASCRAR